MCKLMNNTDDEKRRRQKELRTEHVIVLEASFRVGEIVAHKADGTHIKYTARLLILEGCTGVALPSSA